MPRFFTTTSVREDLAKYIKKDEYKNCKQDLCAFFQGKSIDDIFNQPILISPASGLNFIKSRLLNSSFNKGKSGGYRLYYFANLKEDSVYLVGFFPKTGKYGGEDLTDTRKKLIVQQFNAEKKFGYLEEHDVNNQFEVIPKKVNKDATIVTNSEASPSKKKNFIKNNR